MLVMWSIRVFLIEDGYRMNVLRNDGNDVSICYITRFEIAFNQAIIYFVK